MDINSWLSTMPYNENQSAFGTLDQNEGAAPTATPMAPAAGQTNFLAQHAIPAWLEFQKAIVARPQFDEAKARRQARIDAGLRSIGSALEFLGRGGSAHQAPGLGGTVAAYAGMGEEVDKAQDRRLKQHFAMLEPHKDLGSIAAYFANAEGDVDKAAAAWHNAQSADSYRQNNLARQINADQIRESIARARLAIAQANAATNAFNARSAHNARQFNQQDRITFEKQLVKFSDAQFVSDYEKVHGKGSAAKLSPQERELGVQQYWMRNRWQANTRPDVMFGGPPNEQLQQWQGSLIDGGGGGGVGDSDDELPSSWFD